MSEQVVAHEDQIRAALMLNHCTVSITQIIDYKDVFVLEHEYHAVINNLNMEQCLKDEALKRLFNRMLDVITHFRIQEGDRQWLQREYENNMKNALFNCLPSMNIIVAGGNPWTLLVSAAHQVGTAYFNYRKNKNQYQMQKEKGEWELTKGAWENFNQLRKELFNAQWDMSAKYKMPDEYMLKEKQIEDYNRDLLLEDPDTRMEQLEYLEDDFRAFPPYWFYRAQAAGDAAQLMLESKEGDKAQHYREQKIKCLDQFDTCWMPILRSDVFAYTSALERIKELDHAADNDKILTLLDRIAKHAKHERDIMQICAFEYLAIGEYPKAERLLKWLVNGDYNIPLNGRVLSSLYVEGNREAEYKILADRIGEDNVCPPGKRLGESLVAQKSRLNEECRDLSSQLANRYGQIWANMAFSELADMVNKYSDPDFTNVDEILKYFTVVKISKAYTAGLEIAKDYFQNHPLFNVEVNPDAFGNETLVQCAKQSSKILTKLKTSATRVEALAKECKGKKPSTLKNIAKGGAVGYAVGSLFGPLGIGVALVANYLHDGSKDKAFEAAFDEYNKAIARFFDKYSKLYDELVKSTENHMFAAIWTDETSQESGDVSAQANEEDRNALIALIDEADKIINGECSDDADAPSENTVEADKNDDGQ